MCFLFSETLSFLHGVTGQVLLSSGLSLMDKTFIIAFEFDSYDEMLKKFIN